MSARGYIIDAPNALVITKNNVLNMCTAKSGEIKIDGEAISIEGGWSIDLLAKIDTKRKIEIGLKDAQWKMNTFAMQTGGELKKEKGIYYHFGDNYAIKSNKITIPYKVKLGTLRIEGLTETYLEAPNKGNFKTTSEISSNTTTVEFAKEDFKDGDIVSPIFAVEEEGEILSVKNNSHPKGGTTILQYPVYGKNPEDDTVQEEIGIAQWTIYKTAIDNSGLGMGGNYKTASEFDVKLTGLNPHRPDGKIFEFAFFPKKEVENII